MKFTYLDLIDPTIIFDPVMARNWFVRGDESYALFASDESLPSQLPGYEGKRCVIDLEMAEVLSKIQKTLLPQGLSLKVYDAYRPQRAVNFFIDWMESEDTVLAKKYHYPNVSKMDLHALSYLSHTSSHTLGTAVDLTIIKTDLVPVSACPKDYLGYFDPQSVDMGVGYLAFDVCSWLNYSHITDEQRQNREFLTNIMISNGFDPLETEFWHYYYKRDRNLDNYHDFIIKDDLLF